VNVQTRKAVTHTSRELDLRPLRSLEPVNTTEGVITTSRHEYLPCTFAFTSMHRRLKVLSLAFASVQGLRVAPSLSATRLPSLRGGAAFSMTATVEAPAAPVEKFRKDYTPPPYMIDTVQLGESRAPRPVRVRLALRCHAPTQACLVGG